jgi:hypothetical protein
MATSPHSNQPHTESPCCSTSRPHVDGTKVHANASREQNADFDRIAREIPKEAAEVAAAEDELYGEKRGDELPEHLSTSQGRREWLREAKRLGLEAPSVRIPLERIGRSGRAAAFVRRCP